MTKIKEADGRKAIDWMTRNIKEHESKKGNVRITNDAARRKAEEIAIRYERKSEK